jgi:hypothetical protein
MVGADPRVGHQGGVVVIVMPAKAHIRVCRHKTGRAEFGAQYWIARFRGR